MRFFKSTLVPILAALLMATACVDDHADDCKMWLTCPSEGGSNGDGDTGGSPASGGDNSGGGDGDTGGTGGDEEPACEPACSADMVCDEDAKECVECLKDGDCDGDGDTPLCDTAANSCVACLENSDCSDEMPVCDAGECGTCSTNNDCMGRDDASVCEDTSGACVECTITDESACGLNSCDPATNTCTNTPRGGTENCEACVADSECEEDHFCVPMNYKGEARGGYCLKTSPGCAKPFGIPITGRITLSGTGGTSFCGINEALTTCEAVNALRNDQTCTNDPGCPEAGLCRTVGGLLGKRCTYECSDPVECKNSPLPGSSCGAGVVPDPVTPDYCGGI